MKKNNTTLTFVLLIIIIVGFVFLFFKDKILELRIEKKLISFLTYSDVVKLASGKQFEGNLYNKLNKQLNTPHVVNRHVKFPFQSPYLRIASWNIERGNNLNAIKNVLLNPTNNEARALAKSDIVSLNEVDIGIPRTNYKNVIAELADSLDYNYAFVTEFIELGPIISMVTVDSSRYLGLHGNAILSRYPIKSARIIRLPECYKWYEAEITRKSPLEHVRRFSAKTVFEENILLSEVRRGGRCALVSDIELPNREIVTVVSTHLEDRCYPDCRLKQIEYLFGNLRSLTRPIVIAGDFNTSTTDAAPTSVKKEIIKRVRDPHFIARQIAFAAIPGAPLLGSFISAGVSKLFQYKDPAVPSIPILFPNQERKLFNFIKGFRFADGERIDVSGNRSSNNKRGFLASSNERQLKGFESTFKYEEPRVIGYYKLDWFFVKPKGNRFKPFNGQTLKLANLFYNGRISDHDPITVDLKL
ncbi:MAG: endonuclease/exonuclease/phosphatase family protein [Candidatus Melainabacteria bacterium]|nr:endonuclease/exonuclease/phosphatase family protein [Candidatus Melainabacteria bacterium]